MPDAKPAVAFEDFLKLDIRTAKVLEVRDHPNADKLICMTIDLGTERREIIAGLKGYCQTEALVGKTVIVVTNLPPRKMRGMDSNAMLLAATYEQAGARQVVVLTTAADVPPGATIS
jgi:methionine--tRNA ligase beta chain